MQTATHDTRTSPAEQVRGAGDLQWKLDLARPPEQVLDRARHAARRQVAVLAVAAAAVWSYDAALVLVG